MDKLDNVKKLCRGDVRRRAMHYSLLLGGQGWRSSVIGRSICVQDRGKGRRPNMVGMGRQGATV